MRVIQVLPTYSYGDAVGNDVTAIRAILRDAGYDECVYAENIDKRVETPGVYEFAKQWAEPDTDDVIIYHMSVGWDDFPVIASAGCRKIAVYHNVTPEKFFAPYDASAYMHCRGGIAQVKAANGVFDFVFADSAFNKGDLESYGYTCSIDVLPILIPYGDYRKKPGEGVIRKWKSGEGSNIIYVGRMAPNKCIQDIIAGFCKYKQYYDPAAKLFLVGGYSDGDAYYQRLSNYVGALGVEDVRFTGHIPFKDILAYYTIADAVVCMSEHEGFCVPLVEAMLFDVPVVAYDACAVGDTLGAGGLLLPEKDPLLVAGAIDKIVRDGDLRQAIRKGQKAQLDRFSYDRVKAQFLERFNAFLSETERAK